MSSTTSIIKGFFKGLLLVALTIAAFSYFLSADDIKGIRSISSLNLLWIVLVTQLVYVISGIELAVIVYFNSHVRLKFVDIMLLPVTMNLWSFIIPFQGSLIYSTFFLKYKYKTSVSAAVSTSIFSYLLAMVLSGLFGLILICLSGNYLSWPGLVSLGLLSFPLLLVVAEFVIVRSGIDRIGVLKRLTTLVHTVIKNLQQLFMHKQLLAIICCTNTLHMAACFMMNYLTALALGMATSATAILIFTLVIRLSVILKITPGNVGVQELLSGGVFSMMMLDAADGVLITLVSRVTTIVMMCTIGVAHTYFNSGYFEIGKLFAKDASAQSLGD